jgi:hypothetical protein
MGIKELLFAFIPNPSAIAFLTAGLFATIQQRQTHFAAKNSETILRLSLAMLFRAD